MDTTQLGYFIAVAQTLSFSEAARRCGISQPSISHSISELEKMVGTPLFYRTRQGVTLTEPGREMLPRAIEIVDMAEKMTFQLRQLESGKRGSLSISALTTSSAILSRCLSVFSHRYPDIMTDIAFTSGRSQVMAMNEKRYDFHFAVQEMVPSGTDFESIVTHRDHLCLAFPANHPLADSEPDFARLADEPFIAVSETDGPALYSEIMRVCKNRGYTPNVVCKYDRAEAVLLSVGAGVGISIIPEALQRVFYSENVRFVCIPGEDTVRNYVAAWHREMVNPAARLFLGVVKELFGSEQ